MKFCWSNLLSALAVMSSVTAQEAREVKNIAIVGAGAAGSSAAYYLQKFAEENFIPNITIFEKTDRIGGRSMTVNAFDYPFYPIELGASIFVKINHILYDAVNTFDLSLGSIDDGQASDITAIWDGDRFVYQSVRGESFWWDAGRMFWRYGTSPYYAMKLTRSVVAKFLNLYEEPWFPFNSLTERCFELGLTRITGMTGEQLLAEHKINPRFSRDIIQAATRVNYASNLAHIHGLEAMVSIATDGAVAVSGGNWRIFDAFVKHSGGALYHNTSVTSILLDESSTPTKPKYSLSTKSAGLDTSSSTFPVTFDSVIVATPWQFSDITADKDVMQHSIDKIPYVKLHVTLFTSPFRFRPSFFSLEPGSKVPTSVYTTLGEGETSRQGTEGVGKSGFYSVSTLRTLVNPRTQKLEHVYKIFSAEKVTPRFLESLLGAPVPDTFTTQPRRNDGSSSSEVEVISWYYPHWFHAYPVELPRVTFQDPILGNGLYYTSGMDSFISTMETNALMGKNVAKLIANDFSEVGQAQTQPPSTKEEGELLGKDDFFDSMESEFLNGIKMQGPGEL